MKPTCVGPIGPIGRMKLGMEGDGKDGYIGIVEDRGN
jgi:hypothetical protein